MARTLLSGRPWRAVSDRISPSENLELRPVPGMLERQVRQSDVLFQCNRRRTARDMADFFPVDVDGVVIASDVPAEHFETGEFAANAIGFLLCQGFSSDEVAFIEFHDPAQSRFEQRRSFIQIVAVKQQPCFKTKRVARAESGG
jgi:hypothetical protein